MTEHGTLLRSDPLADEILEIVNGATKYKILLQCLEAGFFDAIESLGEPSTLETLSKKFGYNLEILERLLNALISYNLISVDQNKRGATVYRNSPCTSKYLTRAKKPTMIGLVMMTDKMCSPLVENLPDLLKNGFPKFDVNKNIPDMKKEMNKNNINQIDVTIETNITDKKMVPSKTESMQIGSPTKTQKIRMPTNGTIRTPMQPNGNKNMANGMMGNKMPQMNGMMSKLSIMMPHSMIKNGSMENPPCDMLSKFIMSTDAFSCSCASAVVRAFDLSPHRAAVDLGGGSGRISVELSNAYPDMKVTMFDLPPVVQIAQKFFPNNTNGQLQYVAGDFFEDELPLGDLYIMGHIIHSWEDTSVDKLLSKVFQKLPPGGSLLVLEKVLSDDKAGPVLCTTNDILLALMSKGRERNSTEYQKLFAKHGFTNVQFRYIEGFNYCDAILVKKPF